MFPILPILTHLQPFGNNRYRFHFGISFEISEAFQGVKSLFSEKKFHVEHWRFLAALPGRIPGLQNSRQTANLLFGRGCAFRHASEGPARKVGDLFTALPPCCITANHYRACLKIELSLCPSCPQRSRDRRSRGDDPFGAITRNCDARPASRNVQRSRVRCMNQPLDAHWHKSTVV